MPYRLRLLVLLALGPLVAATACSSTTPRAAAGPASVRDTATKTTHDPAASIGKIKHLLSPGGYLDGLTVADGVLWATDLDGNRVVRVQVSTLHRLPDIPVPDGPLAVVTHAGAVWVASYKGSSVTRLDARTGEKTTTVKTPSAAPCGLAGTAAGMWIFDQSDGAGLLVDARTGAVLRKVKTRAQSGFATAAYGSVWVPDFTGTSGAVQRLDASTGTHQATIKTGQGPIAVAEGDESVWVANANANTVSRIDPATDKVQARIDVPAAAPVFVLIADGYGWVSGYSSSTLYRIDLSDNTVDGTLTLPGPPENMALAGGLLWITMSNGQLAGIALGQA